MPTPVVIDPSISGTSAMASSLEETRGTINAGIYAFTTETEPLDQEQGPADQSPYGEHDRKHTFVFPVRHDQDQAQDDLNGAESETSEGPTPSRPSLDLERSEQPQRTREHRRGPQHVDQYVRSDQVLKRLSQQH